MRTNNLLSTRSVFVQPWAAAASSTNYTAKPATTSFAATTVKIISKAGGGGDALYGDHAESSLQTHDTLFGLGGNDRFFTNNDFMDLVRGGAGDDTADADDEDDVLAMETIT